MLHKRDPADTKPCWHMRTLVSSLADNQLGGLLRWFTRQHVTGCPQCQTGLATIESVRARLRELEQTPAASLPPARWEKVEAAWEQTDGGGI